MVGRIPGQARVVKPSVRSGRASGFCTARLLRKNVTGALVSIYRLTGDLTQVFGPMAIGRLLDAVGYSATFLGLAAFGLLALFSMALRPDVR